MESPRAVFPHPLPSTPRMDAMAADEDRRPRQRARAREVSSRYMLGSPSSSAVFTSLHTPSLGSSAPEPRTSSGAPLPPPLPNKKPPIKQTGPPTRQKQHGLPLHSRRSPSPSLEGRRPPIASSPEVSDCESDAGFFPDENRLSRSSDTPLPTVLGPVKPPGIERRKAVLRLFGENREDRQHGKVAGEGGQARGGDGRPPTRKPRLGTPMVSYQERVSTPAATPRIDPGSRAATTRRAAVPTPSTRAAPTNGVGAPLPPPRLTDENLGDNLSVVTSSSDNSSVADVDLPEIDTRSFGSQDGWCESPKIRGAQRTINRNRVTTECRSSMPDTDRMSGKFQGDSLPSSHEEAGDVIGNCRGTPSLCHRSLNSALSSCAFQSQLTALRAATQQQHKVAWEAKKGGRKAAASRHEDIHALRMMHNQYLQWRFINAKSQTVEKARTCTAQKSLYALSVNLSQLRDSVAAKRAEMERLKNLKRVTTILDAQMPYLEKWGILEDEFSQSLTGAKEALQDASTRIPLVENAKADVLELSEVLSSGLKLMDALSPHVGSFLSHVEGIDSVACDLAKVATTELALVEECGSVLSEMQQLQMVECSLRSQLIQLKHTATTSLLNKTVIVRT